MSTNIENRESNRKLILLDNKKGTKENSVLLAQFILSNALFILLLFSFIGTIQLRPFSFYIFIPGILLSVFLFIIRNRRWTMVSIYSVILVCLFFIYRIFIVNGLLIIVNQMIKILGLHMGIFFLPYKLTIPTDSHELATNFILAYIGLFLSLFTYYLVKQKKSIILWIILIILFIVQSVFEVETLLFSNIILLFLALYMTISSVYHEQHMLGSRQSTVLSFAASFMLIVLLISSVAVLTFKPITEYEKGKYTTLAQQKSEQLLQSIRYGKNEINSFTEGDFTKLGPLQLREDVALEIIMDNPTSIYLRGFTGSIYTSDRWEELDNDIVYKKHDLLYWLNKEDFHPLNQLSIVNQFINKSDLSEKTTITINNLQANSKYFYTPYELITKPEELDKRNALNDRMTISNKWAGERIYTYDSYTNLIKHYPTLASELYQRSDQASQYIQHEGHYNEFVYDVYTNIPESVHSILNHHLKVPTEDNSHIAYEKAIDTVRTYLSENISYHLEPEALPNNRDFFLHVLEDSKEGYATHYATAATLMFRYFHIPARYVEGYLVTPKDVENKKPYEKIAIKGTNAHAWTEIYIDKIGWIPIEVTPPYYNMMEPIDVSNYPKGTDDIEEESKTEELDNDQSAGTRKVKDKEKRDVLKDKEDETTFDGNIIVLIMISVLLFILLIIVAYLIKKRIAFNKLKKSFTGTDLNDATMNMFSYMMFLLHLDGIEKRGGSAHVYANDIETKYGQAFASHFKHVVDIHQAAMYRPRKISQEEYQLVASFMNETVNRVTQSKSLFQRLKMKLWDNII